MQILKLPLPYYGPADDNGATPPEKSEAEKQRENIKVVSSNDKKEVVEPEVKDDEVKDDEVEDETEVEAEAEAEVEEEEHKELTPEQKENEALKKKLERAQRRAGKTASERDENKKLVKDLKAQLDAKIAEGTQPLTEEEVNRRARELANQDLTQREFDQAQEKLIESAMSIDKTFMSKVREMAGEVAPLPEFFIGALNDLDNGGAVLNYLTDNHDDYEDLLAKKNPMKVMKGLIEISNKLIDAAKPKPKKISQAPEPAKAPKGNGKNPDALPLKPTDNMAEYIRIRALQDKARREARGD